MRFVHNSRVVILLPILQNVQDFSFYFFYLGTVIKNNVRDIANVTLFYAFHIHTYYNIVKLIVYNNIYTFSCNKIIL